MSSFRRIIAIFVLGLLGIFLQGTVLRPILPEFCVPNLVLVVVIFIAFYEATVAGAIIAFFLGLQVDLFSGLLLGPWAGAFVLVFAIIAAVSQRIFVESPLAVSVTVFFSAMLSSFIFAVLVGSTRENGWHWQVGVLAESFVTALVSWLMFKLMRWMFVVRERKGANRLLAPSYVQ